MSAKAVPYEGMDPTPTPEITPTTPYFRESFGTISDDLAFLSAEMSPHVGTAQDPDIRNVLTPELRELITRTTDQMNILSGLVETCYSSSEPPRPPIRLVK